MRWVKWGREDYPVAPSLETLVTGPGGGLH